MSPLAQVDWIPIISGTLLISFLITCYRRAPEPLNYITAALTIISLGFVALYSIFPLVYLVFPVNSTVELLVFLPRIILILAWMVFVYLVQLKLTTPLIDRWINHPATQSDQGDQS